MNNKIPKIIHYCWFSGDEKPEKIQKCIDSWSEIMPDYEIKCWDANSFDFDSVPYVKSSFKNKQWAFVADYIRAYAVYSEGGIYLDSDVMVLKSFDSFLNDDMFIGTEVHFNYSPEPAIFGAKRYNTALRKIMGYYETINIDVNNRAVISACSDSSDNKENSKLMLAPMVFYYILKEYGYKKINEFQKLDEGINVYPIPVFSNSVKINLVCEKTYAIHLFAAAWQKPTYTNRKNEGLFFKFCRQVGFSSLYSFVENTRLWISGLFRKS